MKLYYSVDKYEYQSFEKIKERYPMFQIENLEPESKCPQWFEIKNFTPKGRINPLGIKDILGRQLFFIYNPKLGYGQQFYSKKEYVCLLWDSATGYGIYYNIKDGCFYEGETGRNFHSDPVKTGMIWKVNKIYALKECIKRLERGEGQSQYSSQVSFIF